MNKGSRTNSGILIIARVPSLAHRARVAKLVRASLSVGRECTVWKVRGDDSAPPGVVIRSITSSRGGMFGRAIEYVRWAWVVWSLLRRNVHRYQVVWCVGIESAVPALLSRGTRDRLIFDHADNASKSYRVPAIAAWLMRQIEAWVARQARIHLVPAEDRWPDGGANLRVVPNTVSRAALEDARAIFLKRSGPPGRRYTLFVNGWLQETRGLRTLLRALEVIDSQGERVGVLVAGEVGCSQALELVSRQDVTYLGVISNEEALSYYFDCRAVFAFYDPALEINRKARPNKWGDAVATRTPIVSNKEIETIGPLVDAGACVVCPYDDYAELAELLIGLASDQSLFERLQAGTMSLEVSYWDDAVAEILKEVV